MSITQTTDNPTLYIGAIGDPNPKTIEAESITITYTPNQESNNNMATGKINNLEQHQLERHNLTQETINQTPISQTLTNLRFDDGTGLTTHQIEIISHELDHNPHPDLTTLQLLTEIQWQKRNTDNYRDQNHKLITKRILTEDTTDILKKAVQLLEEKTELLETDNQTFLELTEHVAINLRIQLADTKQTRAQLEDQLRQIIKDIT